MRSSNSRTLLTFPLYLYFSSASAVLSPSSRYLACIPYIATSPITSGSPLLLCNSRRLLSPSFGRMFTSPFASMSIGGASDDEAEHKPPRDRKKRRIALVLGYVGTAYSGLQKSDDADINTIESTLEKAMYEAGYIRESNLNDLEKIGWARCSRTDKGVHAARNVISAKLEMKMEDLLDSDWSELAVEDINRCLPEDIRVHSCAKVTKGFRPRDAVSFREYEYVLPISMLGSLNEDGTTNTEQPFDGEAAIEKFCALLQKYQGTHNFHNFTKIKSRDLVRKLKGKIPGVGSGGWVHKNPRNGEGNAGKEEEGGGQGQEKKDSKSEGEESSSDTDDDEEDDWKVSRGPAIATARVDGVRRFNTGVALNPLFELLRGAPQATKAGGNNKRKNEKKELDVEHVVIGDPADNLTTALWDLTRYQGILKMVRTNIYRCEGRPLEVDGKKFVSVSLYGSSFLYNQIRLLVGGAIGVVTGLLPEEALDMALGSPYLLYSPLAPAEGLYLRHITFGRKSKNPVVMHEWDLPQEGEEQETNGAHKIYALMSRTAADRADHFEKEKILTQIIRSWTPELIENWREYSTSFRSSPEVSAQMVEKYAQWKGSMMKLEEAKAGRELFRRQSMATWLEKGEEAAMDIGRRYRRWMPQRFATDLIIKFRLKPGKQVADVQRGLASWIAAGEIPVTATSGELFAIIEEKGLENVAGVGASLGGADEDSSDDGHDEEK